LFDCDLLLLVMILHGTAMKYNLNAIIEPFPSSLRSASLCRQPPVRRAGLCRLPAVGKKARMKDREIAGRMFLRHGLFTPYSCFLVVIPF
jgi:hypothetical protein